MPHANGNTIENLPLQSIEELVRPAAEAGEQRVEDEIKVAYEGASIIGEHESLDLLRFWQVSTLFILLVWLFTYFDITRPHNHFSLFYHISRGCPSSLGISGSI